VNDRSIESGRHLRFETTLSVRGYSHVLREAASWEITPNRCDPFRLVPSKAPGRERQQDGCAGLRRRCWTPSSSRREIDSENSAPKFGESDVADHVSAPRSSALDSIEQSLPNFALNCVYTVHCLRNGAILNLGDATPLS